MNECRLMRFVIVQIIKFIVLEERLLSVNILQPNAKTPLRFIITRLLQARLALYVNYYLIELLI